MERVPTASQLTSPASQRSKDLNKVPLLLQDLEFEYYLSSLYSRQVPILFFNNPVKYHVVSHGGVMQLGINCKSKYLSKKSQYHMF